MTKNTQNMQSLKIIIAAAVVMFATNILTSCVPLGPSSAGLQRIEEAQAYKKTLTMVLQEADGNDDVNLLIYLENPDGKAITSAQTWLSYNPAVLRGTRITTDESAFALMAPYDNNFDQEAGLVMIGRSNQEPITDARILVAEIGFDRVGPGAIILEAFDFQQDLEGHTSANMVENETPYNLLLKPESPLITIVE